MFLFLCLFLLSQRSAAKLRGKDLSDLPLPIKIDLNVGSITSCTDYSGYSCSLPSLKAGTVSGDVELLDCIKKCNSYPYFQLRKAVLPLHYCDCFDATCPLEKLNDVTMYIFGTKACDLIRPPSERPSFQPTSPPTPTPTAILTAPPTTQPTAKPTITPTLPPTTKPTARPTARPTAIPTAPPTTQPTAKPTITPTLPPTAGPTIQPSQFPTSQPSSQPTSLPSANPSTHPSEQPFFVMDGFNFTLGNSSFDGEYYYDDAGSSTPVTGPTRKPAVTLQPTIIDSDYDQFIDLWSSEVPIIPTKLFSTSVNGTSIDYGVNLMGNQLTFYYPEAYSIWVDNDGAEDHLFVADQTYNLLWKVDVTPSTNTWTLQSPPLQLPAKPSGLWGDQHYVYVVVGRSIVYKYDRQSWNTILPMPIGGPKFNAVWANSRGFFFALYSQAIFRVDLSRTVQECIDDLLSRPCVIPVGWIGGDVDWRYITGDNNGHLWVIDAMNFKVYEVNLRSSYTAILSGANVKVIAGIGSDPSVAAPFVEGRSPRRQYLGNPTGLYFDSTTGYILVSLKDACIIAAIDRKSNKMYVYAGNGEPGNGQDGNGFSAMGSYVFFPESISGNGHGTTYILQSFGSLRVVMPSSPPNGTNPNDDDSIEECECECDPFDENCVKCEEGEPKCECKCECDPVDTDCEVCEEDDPKCDECDEEEQDCEEACEEGEDCDEDDERLDREQQNFGSLYGAGTAGLSFGAAWGAAMDRSKGQDDDNPYNNDDFIPGVHSPTSYPTSRPNADPTENPTSRPTRSPIRRPTSQPTRQPTRQPLSQPTSQPTKQPVSNPTSQPTTQPSTQPTTRPSGQPSRQPSSQPTTQPSGKPTSQLTGQPLATAQSTIPSFTPTEPPIFTPTMTPTARPTMRPSGSPTRRPTVRPTATPTTRLTPLFSECTDYSDYYCTSPLRSGGTVSDVTAAGDCYDYCISYTAYFQIRPSGSTFYCECFTWTCPLKKKSNVKMYVINKSKTCDRLQLPTENPTFRPTAKPKAS